MAADHAPHEVRKRAVREDGEQHREDGEPPVVGIVREVLSWPTYSLSLLDRLPIPTVAGVVPWPPRAG